MAVKRRPAVRLGALVMRAGVAWLLLRPTVYPVETARVERGMLRVTVDEDGVTRIQQHVEITAPVSGRLAESRVEVGDSVAKGMVVARLSPAPLDARAREEARASLAAARARRSESEAGVQQAAVLLAQARRDRSRAETLARTGAVAREDL